MPPTVEYRPEVDGLRAIAVLPVVLFHAGIPGFEGGFVGVDVFFVISGYLITSIIIREMQAGTFTFAGFYERRARRILPALYTVTLASAVVAWYALLPEDFAEFARSVIAVVGFFANVLFWRESGYFATASEMKPMLHTWSLAIEEQYYVLFPAILLLGWTWIRRWVGSGLALVALASFGLAVWGTTHQPSATFFLLPTRAWELVVGVLIALAALRPPSVPDTPHPPPAAPRPGWLGLAGLGLIALSVVMFDEATPFPGAAALLPTLGTAAVLIFAVPGSTTARLLSTGPLVLVGLMSYSIYLWHQPALAFLRHIDAEPPGVGARLAIVALACVVAAVSYRLIEKPFRRPIQVPRGSLIRWAAGTSVLLVAFGITGHLTGGFPGRFPLSDDVAATFAMAPAPDCFDRDRLHEREDWLCHAGAAQGKDTVVMFGDSHALAALPAFDAAGQREGVHVIFSGASGCVPFLGVHALRQDQAGRNCHQLNRRMHEFVRTRGIGQVFLVARWSYYTDGGYWGEDFSYLGLSASDSPTRTGSREAFRRGIARTADAYAGAGSQLVILAQVPEQRRSPRHLYYRLSRQTGGVSEEAIRDASITPTQHAELNRFADEALRGEATPARGFRILDPGTLLCDGVRCAMGTPQTSFYSDQDHLSLIGSLKLVPMIRSSLRR